MIQQMFLQLNYMMKELLRVYVYVFTNPIVFWLCSYPLKQSTVFAFDSSFYTIGVPVISKNHLVNSTWILRDRVLILETIA